MCYVKEAQHATSKLKHGALVPHGGYWHCYDRSPRAFGPRASIITVPISSMWHSGPCFNLYLGLGMRSQTTCSSQVFTSCMALRDVITGWTVLTILIDAILLCNPGTGV